MSYEVPYPAIEIPVRGNLGVGCSILYGRIV